VVVLLVLALLGAHILGSGESRCVVGLLASPTRPSTPLGSLGRWSSGRGGGVEATWGGCVGLPLGVYGWEGEALFSTPTWSQEQLSTCTESGEGEASIVVLGVCWDAVVGVCSARLGRGGGSWGTDLPSVWSTGLGRGGAVLRALCVPPHVQHSLRFYALSPALLMCLPSLGSMCTGV